MDPTFNPYAPGAGTQPPELAGRDEIIANARVALIRTHGGRPAKGQMLLGLRGVGKTVLLNRIEEIAEEVGCQALFIEAPENRRLADLIVPQLRRLLLKLDRGERVHDKVKSAMRALRSFAGAFKVSVGDFDVGMTEADSAGTGDLELDLTELFVAVGQAAQQVESSVALIIDELQYVPSEDLGALIVAIHKTNQRSLPIILFGAGLPQLAALAGEAKSYAERLFDYPPVGPLDESDARDALAEPARRYDVEYEGAALGSIVATTKGYPYFLQEWGKQAWDIASSSPITLRDAENASREAIQHLDNGFFRVRVDRLTPREKRYLRSMAELGPGPHRSGDIARLLDVGINSVAPLRQALIRKGMIYSPAHGDTAFTVPMFDEYLRRTMPWPS